MDAIVETVAYGIRECCLAYVLTHAVNDIVAIGIISIDVAIAVYQILYEDPETNEIAELLSIMFFVISLCIVCNKPKPVTVLWIGIPLVMCYLTYVF